MFIHIDNMILYIQFFITVLFAEINLNYKAICAGFSNLLMTVNFTPSYLAFKIEFK